MCPNWPLGMLLRVINRSPRGIKVYIDPNAPPPNTQPTSTGTAPGGMAGSGLSEIVHAAHSGLLRVDPATGDATIRALTDVQEEVGRYLRNLTSQGRTGTRLGGGYAEQIDEFNKGWSTSGPGSAFDVLSEYVGELERLKEAVRASMVTYQNTDAESAARVNAAGPTR